MYDNERTQLSGMSTAQYSEVHATKELTVNELIDDLYSVLSRFEAALSKHGEKISPITRWSDEPKVPSEAEYANPSGNSDIYMRLDNLRRLLDIQVRNLDTLTGLVQL